jgi:hypothetical protein
VSANIERRHEMCQTRAIEPARAIAWPGDRML